MLGAVNLARDMRLEISLKSTKNKCLKSNQHEVKKNEKSNYLTAP